MASKLKTIYLFNKKSFLNLSKLTILFLHLLIYIFNNLYMKYNKVIKVINENHKIILINGVFIQHVIIIIIG